MGHKSNESPAELVERIRASLADSLGNVLPASERRFIARCLRAYADKVENLSQLRGFTLSWKQGIPDLNVSETIQLDEPVTFVQGTFEIDET